MTSIYFSHFALPDAHSQSQQRVSVPSDLLLPSRTWPDSDACTYLCYQWRRDHSNCPSLFPWGLSGWRYDQSHTKELRPMCQLSLQLSLFPGARTKPCKGNTSTHSSYCRKPPTGRETLSSSGREGPLTTAFCLAVRYMHT